MIELTKLTIRRQSGDDIEWREEPLLVNPRYIVSLTPAWTTPHHLYPGTMYEITLVKDSHFVVCALIGDDPSNWAQALSEPERNTRA